MMTEKELFEKICQLQRTIDNLEQENEKLRAINTILRDDLNKYKRCAQVGEATENFFKEIKRIMR